MNKFLEASLENAEAVTDVLTNNELLKSIPFVSTAVKLLEGTLDLRDRLFAAKIQRFIQELDSVASDEKVRFKEALANEPEVSARAGETALLLLDKLNDLKKADLLDFYFTCLLRNRIDGHQFRRITNAIDIGFIDDIESFLSSSDCPLRSQSQHMESLYKSGITTIAGGKTYGDVGEIYFESSTMGRTMYELWHEYKYTK